MTNEKDVCVFSTSTSLKPNKNETASNFILDICSSLHLCVPFILFYLTAVDYVIRHSLIRIGLRTLRASLFDEFKVDSSSEEMRGILETILSYLSLIEMLRATEF